MKVFSLPEHFYYWRIIFALLVIGGGWLILSDEPVNQIVPVVQVRADRSVVLDFEVDRAGDYQFALLFSTGKVGKDPVEQQRRHALFGDDKAKGAVIPVSLQLKKDGGLFLNEKIETTGTVRKHDFYRQHIKINSMVRNITIINLPPGHYSAEITLLSDMPELDQINIYYQVFAYTPRNLARVATQALVMDQKIESYWYNIWFFTKWLTRKIWCEAFCADPLKRQRRINVTHAGKPVNIGFYISETRQYSFLLLFDKEGDWDSISRMLHEKVKIIVPISLRIIKDGRVYFEEEIYSAVYDGDSYYIHCKGRKINVIQNYMAVIELQPGYYNAVFTALADSPILDGIATFVMVRYYQYQGLFIL